MMRDDVGERFLLLAVEGAFLQGLQRLGGQRPCCLSGIRTIRTGSRPTHRRRRRPFRRSGARPPSRWCGSAGVGCNTRRRCARRCPCCLILSSYRCGHLMLFLLGAEAQFVDPVDHFAQVVATLDFVFQLAEYLADLVFDGIGSAGALFEAVQVGEELCARRSRPGRRRSARGCGRVCRRRSFGAAQLAHWYCSSRM